MKAFVIMYNRFTWPKKLCEDLEAAGCIPILIDNTSTYPPLLEWYKTCPYKIYTVPNTGSKSLWNSGVINLFDDELFIVTDHDMDISKVPKDFIEVLKQGFYNENIIKVGLSLEIDDLPDNPYAQEAYKWEEKFWNTKLFNDFYSAPVDTTLALYSRSRMNKIKFPFDYIDNSHNMFFSALRSPKLYSARHLPWYSTPENITEEEKYYIDHIGNDGYWTRKFIEAWK